MTGRGRGWRRVGRGLVPSMMGGGGGTLGVWGIDSVVSERMRDGIWREDRRVLENIVSNDEQMCLGSVSDNEGNVGQSRRQRTRLTLHT